MIRAQFSPLRIAMVTLATWASALSAQPPSSVDVVIRGAAVIDGTGIVLPNTDAVVRAVRIVEVRPQSGRADIDLGSRVIAPGLIDTHVHLGWYITTKGRLHQSKDGDSEATAILNAAGNAQRMLQAGFTTIQSVGGTEDAPVRDAIAHGIMAGPRIITSLGSLNERAGPPDSVRMIVRDFKKRGADVIKIFASKSIRDGGVQTMSQEQLDAACGEAKALGLRSIVHAHAASAMKAAVRAGCTQVDHGVLVDDEGLAMMAKTGTYFEPQCELVSRNYLDHKEWFRGIGNYNDEGFAATERSLELRKALVKRYLGRPDSRSSTAPMRSPAVTARTHSIWSVACGKTVSRPSMSSPVPPRAAQPHLALARRSDELPPVTKPTWSRSTVTRAQTRRPFSALHSSCRGALSNDCRRTPPRRA